MAIIDPEESAYQESGEHTAESIWWIALMIAVYFVNLHA